MHELAEGLQSTGSYLEVAKRLCSNGTVGERTMAEAIEKAIQEITRANAAFHPLRTKFGGTPAKIGFRAHTAASGKAEDRL